MKIRIKKLLFKKMGNGERKRNDDLQKELATKTVQLRNDIHKLTMKDLIRTFYTIICLMTMFICFYTSTKYFFAGIFFLSSLIGLIYKDNILTILDDLYVI